MIDKLINNNKEEKPVQYQFQFDLNRSFGPKIGVIKLDDSIVNKMIEITDKLILDTKGQLGKGPKLAGQIKDEIKIPLELLKKEKLYGFFNNIQKHYISQIFNPEAVNLDNIKTGLTEMWVNDQYENEYNPVHWHEGCSLSATLYLKIPKMKPRNIYGKRNIDGNIIFINNNHQSPFQSIESPILQYEPTVGDMFIWPSRLLHGVYPFQGEGTRRSVAFNGIHIDQKTIQTKNIAF